MKPRVLLLRAGPIATLAFFQESGPAVIDHHIWSKLRTHLLELIENPPSVLILTGSEHHFAQGNQLEGPNQLFPEMDELAKKRDRFKLAEIYRAMHDTVDILQRLPTATIAAIEGECFEAGFELALACDFRVASPDVQFRMAQIENSQLPVLGGLQRLTHIIGPTRAADIILTRRKVSAPLALDWGLLTSISETDTAVVCAKSLALRILEVPDVVVQQTLTALRYAAIHSASKAKDQTAQAAALALCAVHSDSNET